MFVAPMPHDDYVGQVAHCLAELGHAPEQWWTTTPDGEQLDGVIILGPSDDWPAGSFLGWDQRTGWQPCDIGTRTLYPLDLGVYASASVVAVRTRDRLTGHPDTIGGEDWNEAPEGWDGANALVEAVKAWESAA